MILMGISVRARPMCSPSSGLCRPPTASFLTVAVLRSASVRIVGPEPRESAFTTGGSASVRFLALAAPGKRERRHGVLHPRNVLPTPRSEPSTTPNLDDWLPNPAIRVSQRRQTNAPPDRLWQAAQQVRLTDARRLGRLVRWRIPGLPPDLKFDEMFRTPPFIVLTEEPGRLLVSGLVGRIWTLRRDYPELDDPEQFRAWSTPGTARVLFANWIEPADHSATIHAEARVAAIGAQGRIGVAAVRPLVRAFGSLIGSDGIEIAARRAEQQL
jgi:hypothetical protein